MHNHLKIAQSKAIRLNITTNRTLTKIDTKQIDIASIIDAAAIMITPSELDFYARSIIELGYEIPFIVICKNPEETNIIANFEDTLKHNAHLTPILEDNANIHEYIESICFEYEDSYLPDFFYLLTEYVNEKVTTFACPGHQSGNFFFKHPVGKKFYDFYGENIFRSDICNADVKLGDLLIHEGAAKKAQAKAAKLYNSDKTYFVLNGTSTANKVVCGALLLPGDLVLFDRNNHKSVHHGALLGAGATPVYMATTRNPYGLIGGINSASFDIDYIQRQIERVAPEKVEEFLEFNQAYAYAKENDLEFKRKRPFRLAVIQLSTYDGTMYNPSIIIDKIGHLCDYILFDSAWAGYEQFITFTKHLSPLNLKLGPKDPGIFVTQSVHKQQSGFSQSSQIHKKDGHLRGQKRYCNHKRFNNSYLIHASTSPFYPIFASLDVNAKIQASTLGRMMWNDTARLSIDVRKEIINRCRYLSPFVPKEINGKPWEEYSTDEICGNMDFFYFYPDDKWHAYEGYSSGQYMIDPCKLLLTTPGINEDGEYDDWGIPAPILASFLRENSLIPEKSDMNSILFLLTPAETPEKMELLVQLLCEFEEHYEKESLISDILPNLYENYPERYVGYTLKQLCFELHILYKHHNLKYLQNELFKEKGLPEYAMLPKEAHHKLIANKVKLIPVRDALGKVAADGALPYPPGVICVVQGERWNKIARDYFLALEDIINRVEGFTPEIQGVFLENVDGRKVAFTYVVDEDNEQWED